MWCYGALGTGQGWSRRPLPASCLRQVGYGAGSHPGSLQKRREGMVVPLRCLPLPAYPARCPLLTISSPSAYILVPARVSPHPTLWAPNEDPDCPSLGSCFLGVHVGQGMGLASLGLW